MQPDELQGRLEHTILGADLLPSEVHKKVTDAMQAQIRAVIVAPVWVAKVATMLRESGVRTVAAVSYPNGTSKSTVKAIEATSCLKDGADEVWIVPFVPNVIRADLDAMKFELLEIVRAARATRREAAIHVLIDARTLASAQTMSTVCRAVRESACDGIAVSNLKIEAVKQFKQHVEGLILTATAETDDAQYVRELLDAGADRVAQETSRT